MAGIGVEYDWIRVDWVFSINTYVEDLIFTLKSMYIYL